MHPTSESPTIRKYFNFGKLRLSYLDSHTESAQCLIWAHANGYSAATYSYYLEALVNHYRVLALDFAGHGNSEGPPQKPIHFSDWGFFRDQIIALMEHEAIDKATLIGHSLGGASALLTALQIPRHIDKVIALDPVLLDPWRRLFSFWHNPLAEAAEKRRSRFKDLEQVKKIFPKIPAFARWHSRIFHDYVQSCFHETDEGVELACHPSLEAHIFRSPSIKDYLEFWLTTKEVHIITMPNSEVAPWISAFGVTLGNPSSRVHLHKGKNHFFPFEEPDWTLKQIKPILFS